MFRKKEAPAERRLRGRSFPLREMDQGIHPESDKAAQRNWFRPFRGPFSLEVGWPRNGSTESARDAGLNTCLREKLRAIAAPSADARLHTVGSVFRAVPGAQEGGSLRHAKKLPKEGP